MNKRPVMITVACVLLAASAAAAFSMALRGGRDQTPPPAPQDTARVTASDVIVTPSDTAEKEIVHPPKIVPVDDSHAKSLEEIVRKYGCISVQAAVIDDGYVSSTYCWGYSDYSAKTKINDDTKIHVASLTKVAVGITAMKAQDEGLFDLDDPLSELLGCEVRNPKHPDHVLTLRDFLTHTASVVSDVSVDGTIEKLLNSKGTYTASKPGCAESWSYSNGGMRIAGGTLEAIIGRTLDDYASEKLFDPIGAKAAFYPSTLEDKSNIACLYTSGHNVSRTVGMQLADGYSPAPGNNRFAYSGGLTVSAKDLAKLVSVLVRDGEYDGTQLLSPGTVAEMQEPNFELDEFEQCIILRHRKDMYDGRELYYHTGDSCGVLGFLSYDEKAREGVVVLTVGAAPARDDRYVPKVCADIAQYVYSEILDGE